MSAPKPAGGPVVCFGELLLRLSPPGAQLLFQASGLDVHVGGAEANVAAALASLGTPARMVSRVPSNPLGRKARAVLAAAGVDVSHIVTEPGRMGLYFLEAGASLRPSQITYDRAGSSFAEALPGDFSLPEALAGASLLHISGITPALGPKGSVLAKAAVQAAQSAGVPVSFDGNFRPQLWAAWNSDPRNILRELVGGATILFGNQRDISLLLGHDFSGDGPDRRREAAQAAFAAFPALQLIASTAREVVSADHHRLAARIDLRESSHQTDAIAITGIVDRIGTGDAFAAGVLHRYLAGAGAVEMAKAGLALAVLKHSLPGDMTLLREEDLAGFSPDGGDVRR